MHRIDIARGVDQRAARRVIGGDAQKPVAQALVEFAIKPLDAVDDRRTPPNPCEAARDRDVEDKGQIGHQRSERDALQFHQIGNREAAAVALVGDRRIGKAIADDPLSRRQRRLDQTDDVIAAGGVEQQRLADGVPALAFAFEQQAADRFRPLGAAGLARLPYGNPGIPERCDEQADLGGFAGPLPALDGDEAAARCGGAGRRAQFRGPQTSAAARIAMRPSGPIVGTFAAA